MEPALWQKQQIPGLQRHPQKRHLPRCRETFIVRRVRVEIAAIQASLGRCRPGAQRFAVMRRGEGEFFLPPDLGEEVVGVIAVQRRQRALGADPDPWRDEQRGVEVGRVLDLLQQLRRQNVVAHVRRRLAVRALDRRAVQRGDELGHRGRAEITLGGKGLLHVIAVAGDALQFSEMHQRFLTAEAEQWPVVQGIADHQRNAVGQITGFEFVPAQLGARTAFDAGLARQRGSELFAEAWRRRIALVHVDLFHRAATLASVVDDLRQHRRQAHVAADLQAPAGEQFLDIDHAGHDPEKIFFSDFDGHVRTRVAPDCRALAGLDVIPERLLRAENELENPLDADRAGVGEQLAQNALQVHGDSSRLLFFS